MAGRPRRSGDLLGHFSWRQSACLLEGVPAVATESGDGATHVFASRKLSTWSSRSLPFANCQGGGPHSHRAGSGELGDSWRARRAPRALSTCGHVLVRAEPDAGHVQRGVHADDQPRSRIPRVFSLRRVCRTDRCSVSCSLSRRHKRCPPSAQLGHPALGVPSKGREITKDYRPERPRVWVSFGARDGRFPRSRVCPGGSVALGGRGVVEFSRKPNLYGSFPTGSPGKVSSEKPITGLPRNRTRPVRESERRGPSKPIIGTKIGLLCK
jgi:hypothetical protein